MVELQLDSRHVGFVRLVIDGVVAIGPLDPVEGLRILDVLEAIEGTDEPPPVW